MTLQIDSASTPYMSELQYLARADVRTVAQLVSDTGFAVGSPVPDPQGLVGNANLIAALTDASGELEAVCLIGARYHQIDLAQIAAATGTGAQGKMFRVLTRMTTMLLWERRMDKSVPQDLAKQVAEDKERLRNGEEIFGSVSHEQAGLVQSRKQKNAYVVREAGRFFGRSAGPGRLTGGYD